MCRFALGSGQNDPIPYFLTHLGLVLSARVNAGAPTWLLPEPLHRVFPGVHLRASSWRTQMLAVLVSRGLVQASLGRHDARYNKAVYSMTSVTPKVFAFSDEKMICDLLNVNCICSLGLRRMCITYFICVLLNIHFKLTTVLWSILCHISFNCVSLRYVNPKQLLWFGLPTDWEKIPPYTWFPNIFQVDHRFGQYR